VAGAANRALFFIALNTALVINALAEVTAPPPSSPADSLAEIIVTAQKRSEICKCAHRDPAVTGDQLRAANLVSANDCHTGVGFIDRRYGPLLPAHLRESEPLPSVRRRESGRPICGRRLLPSHWSAHGPHRCFADLRSQGSSRNPLWPKFHGGVIQMTTKDPQQSFCGEPRLRSIITLRAETMSTNRGIPRIGANVSFRYTTREMGGTISTMATGRRNNKDLAVRTNGSIRHSTAP